MELTLVIVLYDTVVVCRLSIFRPIGPGLTDMYMLAKGSVREQILYKQFVLCRGSLRTNFGNAVQRKRCQI